jgi:mRNA interferase RelE/StbE
LKSYEVQLSAAAAREFRKLPTDVAKRLKPAILALADNPRPQGVVKLAGQENAWRIRSGDYRVLYQIHDRTLLVLVVEIAHRREVYR